MIPVIDVFAGPGGLGEGFSAFRDHQGRPVFKIALSIEKNPDAHKTLKLRSFYRQFRKPNLPEEYYDCLRGKLTVDELYQKFPAEAACADSESWRAELGTDEFPAALIDGRIRKALEGADHWVLIGGPPCQAYSLAGRSRMIPVDPLKYAKDHRHFLYREYLRIIAVHRPPVFVMENVKGILSSKIEGARIIDRILSDLRSPLRAQPELRGAGAGDLEYELFPISGPSGAASLFGSNDVDPSEYIVRCESYGIPQARHRLILLGVRKGGYHGPGRLRPSSQSIDLWDVIKDLPRIRSRISKDEDSAQLWVENLREILSSNTLKNGDLSEAVRQEMRQALGRLKAIRSTGAEFQESARRPNWQSAWFYDSRLGGVCNHCSRSHMKEDLWRYFFVACFAAAEGRSPQLHDFPADLLPHHRNLERIANDEETVFMDRFRVQVKGRPATTITSHIAKDGHYFIHPDATQCRSFTVREAARLQTFPDNYLFLGHRTAQYQQVGNAVPPLQARKIASIVYKLSF